MKAWLYDHRRALLQALRRLAATPLGTILSALAIGGILALPASGEMLLANAHRLLGSLPSNSRISVFMSVGAERRAAMDTAERLRHRDGVSAVSLVTREDTLKRMRSRDDLAGIIALLPANPFPDALIVTPADESPQAMATLAAELRGLPLVDHVQLDSAWAARLEATMRLAAKLIAALAALMGVGLLAITFNTIRLQVLAGRNEIEVSRLLGATEGYVSRPFHWYGLLLGLAGGAIALLLTAGVAWWLRAPAAELAAAYGLAIDLRTLQIEASGAVLALSAVLGWLGSMLSVRQHMKES